MQDQPTCCAGIARMTEPTDYQQAYERADQALYQAKKAGVGCCVVWKEKGRKEDENE